MSKSGPCVECGHVEPHSGGGIGVCMAPGCGCDGPMTPEVREFVERFAALRAAGDDSE